MTGLSLVTLIATVLSADGMALEIDLGTEAGIRIGDRGVIYYEISESEALRRFETGEGSVLDAGDLTAWLLVEPETEVRPGYLVRFEIPSERLAPRAGREAPGARPSPFRRLYVAESVDGCLNLRPLPSTDAPRLDCLPPGLAVGELRSYGDWSEVRLADGREGWVASRLLSAARPPPRQQTYRPRGLGLQVRSAADPGAVDPGEAELRARLAELRSDLEASATARRELESRLADAQSQRDALDQTNAELAAARAAMRLEMDGLRARLERDAADRSAGLAELRARVETAEALAADLERRLERTEAALAEAERVRLDLETRLQEANLDRGALRQQVADLRRERDRLTAELQAARTAPAPPPGAPQVPPAPSDRVREAEAVALDLRGQLELAERALAASEEVQGRLAGRLAGVLTELEGTHEQLATAWTRQRELVAELDESRARVAELAGRVAALETERASLTAELADAREAPGEPPAPPVVVLERADPCLRLRSGPSLSDLVVGCVVPGTTLAPLARTEGWTMVRAADDRVGWVAADYLGGEPASGEEHRQDG